MSPRHCARHINALFIVILVQEMSDLTPLERQLHTPVMLAEVLAHLNPHAKETYLDATFGAGGYSSAILDAVPCQVIALDQDPYAVAAAQDLVRAFGGRLKVIECRFSEAAEALSSVGVPEVDGVVLDIGVSSMQIDQAERGFSFMRDGPLDMRMSQNGQTAADVVNSFAQDDLADIIYVLGEERQSRRIARAIVEARKTQPIRTTMELVRVVESAIGRQKPHERIHPATRTFQALRIFVNAELDELVKVLSASEDLLKEGGRLVVVTFHSLEDRIVKRFFASRSGQVPAGSRHLPDQVTPRAPSFTLPFKGHVSPSEAELHRNPRARSAKLRAGIRTSAPRWPGEVIEPVLATRRHS